MKGRVEMPKFLTDIYGDLRDRRLLLPVVALVVAIAAVPFLLGGDPPPVPSAPAAATVPPDAAELRPAVVVEQTGIRSYRKRLQALRKKNPFEQQFDAAPEETSVAVGSEPADASVSIAGAGDGGNSDPLSSSSPEIVGSSSPGAAPGVSVGGDLSGDSAAFPVEESEEGEETEVREVETVISYSVSVDVGRAGELEEREAVERFAPLPSKQVPVLIYIGVSENGERAAFLVSREVIGTRGDGICIRSKSGDCELVMMKVGEAREFLYGPDGERFRLKLRSISVVEEPAAE